MSTMHYLTWNDFAAKAKYSFDLSNFLSKEDLDARILTLKDELGEDFPSIVEGSTLLITAPATSRVRNNPSVLDGATHTLVHCAVDNAFGPTTLVIGGESKPKAKTSSMSGQL